jgi:hypothetical protein
MSTNVERVLYSLAKYSKRMNGRARRPRGNPKHLIEMLSPLLNGNKCSVCRKPHSQIDLHHVNGIWNDYSIENLIFVCRPCHLYTLHQGSWKNPPIKLSKEIIMHKYEDIKKITTVKKTRRINGVETTTECAPEGTWMTKAGKISEHGFQLLNYVGQLVNDGYSRAQACEELSDYFGVTAGAMNTAYPLLLKRKEEINNPSGVSIGTRSGKKSGKTRIQMTFAEYYHYRKCAEMDGVELIENDDR